ncbi:hypothetical protein AKO1_005238 [Acrasis kona]|uniref:N-acetyltransferase domain-containing protein n=1 Tax=Acrasis kona TaxID=1008807 RepID=A0AAW2YL61_9EUKA
MNVRELKQEELDAWFDHVEECFSEKNPPPKREYFVRHYKNDPFIDISSIIVAVDKNDLIISTARIFHRDMYLNNNTVKFGGIGEVCTKKQHRGEGASKLVLQKIVDTMRKKNVQIGSLHCGDNLIPFYSKFGFEGVNISTCNICVTIKDVQYPHLTLLPLTFNDSSINRLLNDLHSKQMREFNGVIVRDERYWSTWIKSELERTDREHSAWLLVSDSNNICEDTIVSYSFIQKKQNDFVVKDFIPNSHHSHSKNAFYHTINAQARHLGLEQVNVEVFEGLIRDEADSLNITNRSKDKFMYQVFDQSLFGEFNNIQDLIEGVDKETSRHTFLRADSY